MPQDLEKEFHHRMIELYNRAVAECDYRPTRFLQMVHERGGLATARHLLVTSHPAGGLTTLWRHQRLDLSVEALICREPWRALFTDDEIAEAEKRLRALNYEPIRTAE